MFNERIKSMGIGIARYHAYDNTTNYQDYWESAVSPPPENATNVKEYGCYIVKEKDESDRVWVTYTTYFTYHYLCKITWANTEVKRKIENLRQRFSVEQGFMKDM